MFKQILHFACSGSMEICNSWVLDSGAGIIVNLYCKYPCSSGPGTISDPLMISTAPSFGTTALSTSIASELSKHTTIQKAQTNTNKERCDGELTKQNTNT
jgi:hypothetical protein